MGHISGRLNSWPQPPCDAAAHRVKFATSLFSCCLILTKHRTKQMNHFSRTVTADATKKPCAMKLFAATALQLGTRCLLLVLQSLLHRSPFFTSLIITTLGLCEETSLSCHHILLLLKSNTNLTSRPDSSQYLINFTHLSPSGQEWELQSVNLTDSLQKFSVVKRRIKKECRCQKWFD